MKRLELGTAAYAVDTWRGDEHAGHYGDDVFATVSAHAAGYAAFATLMRSTFDEALAYFEDGSIDLLHIDGRHHYEDVQHDFETWLPKLTDDAVVLLHDTNVREREFGVWRFFKELSARHPSFQFVHGHGLGLVCPGSVIPDSLQGLFQAAPDAVDAARRTYASLGHAVAERQRLVLVRQALDGLLRPEVDLSPGSLAALSAAGGNERAVVSIGTRLAAEQSSASAYRLQLAASETERQTVEARLAASEAERQTVEARLAASDAARSDADARLAERQSALEAAQAANRHEAALRAQVESRLAQAFAEEGKAWAEVDRAALAGDLLRRLIRGRDRRLLRLQGEFDGVKAAADAADDPAPSGGGERNRIRALERRLDGERGLRAAAEARLSTIEHSRAWRAYLKLRSALGLRTLPPREGAAEEAVVRDEALAAEVEATGLFDGDYYLARNPDVAAFGTDPALHFATDGWREGRSPSSLFDTVFYLRENPDVAAAGVNPLVHYALVGAAEDRSPLPAPDPVGAVPGGDEARPLEDARLAGEVEDTGLFDDAFYRASNPDVARLGVSPALHFAREGWREGRKPNPDFDPALYLALHRDVAAAGYNPLLHFAEMGAVEGRATSSGGGEGTGPRTTVPTAPEPPAAAPEPPAAAPDPAMPGCAADFAYAPTISIITPVYNIAPALLRKAVASVQAQTYPHWEMCLCDDGSSSRDTVRALTALSEADSRLRVSRHAVNQGISAATNTALSFARGEFVAFLDNDDELVPEALEVCVRQLNLDRDLDILYSDEDKLDQRGETEEPFFKPDWSPSLLREVMYIGHLLVIRRSLVEKIGGLDKTFDGVQDFELALRASEHTDRIFHIRKILYHWRRIPGSVADDVNAKPRLGERQVAAVNAHLRRVGLAATARAHPALQHRAVLIPEPRTTHPRVSIVILTKDQPKLIGGCLDSIFDKTSYPDFEVVVVDNNTTDRDALQAIGRHRVVHVPFDEPFNYSRGNNIGVRASSGEILVFLNNDTEVLDADWLEQMLFLMDDPAVAAVGPMLTYPDGTVQHAGVALGLRGTADHVLRGLPSDADGYFGSLTCTREVSAVTFACAMVRRSDYDEAGGLSEFYATHYQDVDICLRLKLPGKRILYTPRTRLTHHESATRGPRYDAIDRALLLDSWGDVIAAGDPYARWEPEARAGAHAS